MHLKMVEIAEMEVLGVMIAICNDCDDRNIKTSKHQKSQPGCGRWAPQPHLLSQCPSVWVFQCPGVLVS